MSVGSNGSAREPTQLTLFGRAITARFFLEYPKRFLRRPGSRSRGTFSAVASRRTGSVGGMDLSMVSKVTRAASPRLAHQESTLGM